DQIGRVFFVDDDGRVVVDQDQIIVVVANLPPGDVLYHRRSELAIIRLTQQDVGQDLVGGEGTVEITRKDEHREVFGALGGRFLLPGNHRFLDLRGESGPLIACLDVERFSLRYQTGRHLDQSLRGGVVEREREADGYGPEVEDACSDLGRKRSDVHLANLHVQWLMAQNDTRTCCGVRPAQDAGS